MTDYKTVNGAAFDTLVHDRAELCAMLGSLIAMWKREEKLKNHHRPYLHIRRETEKLCNAYLLRLAEITKRTGASPPLYSNGKPVLQKDVSELVGDLVTLAEYIGILQNIIRLFVSGVDMESVSKKFNRFLDGELHSMMVRWERYITDGGYESE